MNKLKLAVVLLLAAMTALPSKAEKIPFDEEHFPDAAVRTWLQGISGAVSNGMVETDKVTSLPASPGSIVDFSCAKYFTKLSGTLTFSYSYWTKLEKLDISGLTGVTTLSNGFTGNSYQGNAHHMPQMKSVIADGCTGLTTVTFPLCENLEYASFDGCSNISKFWMYGKKLYSIEAYNTKLERLDLSASDKLSDVWVAGNHAMKYLVLGDKLPNLMNLDCSDCKIRTLNLKGMPSTVTKLNVQTNRLRHIDVSPITSFTSFYYNGNALTSLAVDHVTTWTNSPNTNNQTVYVGKNTTEFVVIENLPKYKNYQLSLSGGTFRTEDNGNGGTRVICTFNNNSTKVTYTYQPDITNFWSATKPVKQAYERAQLTVTILKQDDPDIAEHELKIVPSECDPHFTTFADEVDLIYKGNGIYEFSSDDKMMGNFQIAEVVPNTMARSEDVAHIYYGGHIDEDTNPADEYVCLGTLGKSYRLVEGSQLHFTTHPDQNMLDQTIEAKNNMVLQPKMTIDYRPEDSVRTLTVSTTSADGGILTGIESVGADSDNDAPAEYFSLQGVKVNASALAPGIYIVRRGNEARKVAVQ